MKKAANYAIKEANTVNTTEMFVRIINCCNTFQPQFFIFKMTHNKDTLDVLAVFYSFIL
jgi:hypothetical protein